jgi:threonine/homoserine/homoserine lactone efflux protein
MNNLDVKKALKALGITTVVILSVFGLFWTIATYPIEFTATAIGLVSIYMFYLIWKLIYEEVL